MIPFQEIQRLSEQEGIIPQTIEKDYCLTWLLIELATSPLADRLVFYGGTAIRKIYLPHHRYSEDLDFTTGTNLKIGSVFGELDKVTRRIRQRSNIIMAVERDSLSVHHDRYLFWFTYDGFPEITQPKTLRMDLATNERLATPPVRRFLHLDYSDMKGVSAPLKCYRVEAIAVEKIGTIFEGVRKEPRDLYDLWVLLKHTRLNRHRLKVIGRTKYGVDLSIMLKGLPERLQHGAFRRYWQDRLRHQIPHLPDFDLVLSETLQRL